MSVSRGVSVCVSPPIVTMTDILQSNSADDAPSGCVHRGESETLGVDWLAWPVAIDAPADSGTTVGEGNGCPDSTATRTSSR